MKSLRVLSMSLFVAFVAITFTACNPDVPCFNPLNGTWKSLEKEPATFVFSTDYSVTQTYGQDRWDENFAVYRGTYFLTRESVVINYTYYDYNRESNSTYDPNDYYKSVTYAYEVKGDKLILGERGASGEIVDGDIYYKQ